MELINLEQNPVAATMVGLGDKVFYRDGKEGDFLEAEISQAPHLTFDKAPEYSIRFLSDSQKYEAGKQITASRVQLNVERGLADRAREAFLLLAG